jgi:hypothetical protein
VGSPGRSTVHIFEFQSGAKPGDNLRFLLYRNTIANRESRTESRCVPTGITVFYTFCRDSRPEDTFIGEDGTKYEIRLVFLEDHIDAAKVTAEFSRKVTAWQAPPGLEPVPPDELPLAGTELAMVYLAVTVMDPNMDGELAKDLLASATLLADKARMPVILLSVLIGAYSCGLVDEDGYNHCMEEVFKMDMEDYEYFLDRMTGGNFNELVYQLNMVIAYEAEERAAERARAAAERARARAERAKRAKWIEVSLRRAIRLMAEGGMTTEKIAERIGVGTDEVRRFLES